MRWPLLLLGLLACDDGTASDPTPDAGQTDSASFDMGAPTDAGPPDAGPRDSAPDAPVGPDASLEWPTEVEVLVLVDGEPSADTLVMQGGTQTTRRTDARGTATLPIDLESPGQVWVVASRPDARIRAKRVRPPVAQPVVIELSRFGPDNADYFFSDPGTPERRQTTAQCGHCHQTINDDWHRSPHRSSATNPRVREIYGALKAAAPGETGGCADCHAPGINGRLGGRDLDEAEGLALEAGVHCDVCHRVERVDLESTAPGVAGRLVLHRPSEMASPSLGAGGFLPITFGPSHDSPNPRMGSVQRDHFRDGRICAGCHEYDQPVLVPGAVVDRDRWPDGRLPVHSTYSEWKAGVLADSAGCPDCHMPPDPSVANGADLQRFPLADVGLPGGWYRPPGSVRRHQWVGPTARWSRMLELAAAVFVRSEVRDGRVHAEVTVRNVAAGHAIPTGEPLRSMLLVVDARCDAPLPAVGGDALPGWAGAVAEKGAGEDWSRWPDAQPGDRVRVVRREGWHDYPAFGAFDGRSPEAKGLPVTRITGEATVVAVEEGVARFSGPLPEGETAWLVRGEGARAGAPGFAFARVMTDRGGRAMVPHYLATDVRSDNRLMPQAAWTSSHVFATTCAEPEIRARLLYRAAPPGLGWPDDDVLMVEARR